MCAAARLISVAVILSILYIFSFNNFINSSIIFGQDFENNSSEYVWAEQEVDCISIAHLPDNISLIFFWDIVQGEFQLLDHRWTPHNASIFRQGDYWILTFIDYSDSHYRVIKTKHWIESQEEESPLAANNRRPWFAQLNVAGLKNIKISK